MDIVLLIISIVFACSKENHSYTALTVLSMIGLIICVIVGIIFSWLFFISAGLYLITLLICIGASNKS
jgi:hypothetical protein